MQIRGRWIIEMGELTSMRTVHVDKIKAFMSRKEDRFRPPYGRVVIEAPRQCVFVGSTNRDEYLHDETGARRFWPVRCGGLRPDDLLKDRDQIWAEALALYRAKVPWWTNDKDLLATIAEEQEARYESDHWESAVLNAMQAIHKKDPEGATIAAIFAEVGKHPLECTEADKRRVGKIARRAKWRLRRSTKPGAHGERRWFYSPAA